MDTTMGDESMGDSLKVMSLWLSVDAKKYSINGSLDNSTKVDKLLAPKGDRELIFDKMKTTSLSFNIEEIEPKPRPPMNNLIVSNKYPTLRNKKRLFVIVVDNYDYSGNVSPHMLEIIQEIIKAMRSDATTTRFSSLVLSTALTIDETLGMLNSGNILPCEFDALICSNGSELYYSTIPSYPNNLGGL